MDMAPPGISSTAFDFCCQPSLSQRKHSLLAIAGFNAEWWPLQVSGGHRTHNACTGRQTQTESLMLRCCTPVNPPCHRACCGCRVHPANAASSSGRLRKVGSDWENVKRHQR